MGPTSQVNSPGFDRVFIDFWGRWFDRPAPNPFPYSRDKRGKTWRQRRESPFNGILQRLPGSSNWESDRAARGRALLLAKVAAVVEQESGSM